MKTSVPYEVRQVGNTRVLMSTGKLTATQIATEVEGQRRLGWKIEHVAGIGDLGGGLVLIVFTKIDN
jgi:hypothetical protein